jgi:glutathione S-transferase
MSLTLYADRFWISPYVYSCFVALREKGIPFEVREVSLGEGEQRRPEFAPSLTTRVPALEHDGFWLAESSAIVEYLDELFADTPMLPRATRDRARARQVLSWIRSDLMALREERSSETIFYESRPMKPLSAQARAAADKLVRVASTLLPGDRAHLFESFGAADADLAFMLKRLARDEDVLPERLRAWTDAQWQRPSVRAFVEHPRAAFVPYF